MTETNGKTDSPDPMQVIERLVRALEQDLVLRTDSLKQLSDLIDKRNELIAAQNAENLSQIQAEVRGSMDVEQARNKRAKWYTGLLGVVAFVIGCVLFALVISMAFDMDRMEDYMYNMGHAAGDERIKPKERKDKGPSYMLSMAKDMGKMQHDMAEMRGDMGAMRVSMSNMDGAMAKMSSDMNLMSTDMHTMSTDMTIMNGTMGKMQYDTLLMRQGVGSMSHDTRSMGVPFRFMDSMVPFQ